MDMVINFVLSTHRVLMSVMCPQSSIATLIHSTDDDDDDDDDSWKLIKLISSAHLHDIGTADFVTCIFRVTFWSLSMNLNNYELVAEPD